MEKGTDFFMSGYLRKLFFVKLNLTLILLILLYS